ncbi:MAG: aminotransferase class I/II-fold pyridoxal phosphate-dependent enzyme [Dehalococcoidia bacterium]|nr:aminotransferase class I/II-fold pyridoxal phosphate-dependent enzyme [Dehalococcoidia bacterium]
MPGVIDLRSDTVTRPSEEMRRVMAAAEVGDDLLGDDPTVDALEEASAEATGKAAGLFVPSGTMGNLVALLTHCGRGDEAIAGSESHILNNEGMGAPALGGISTRAVPNDERGGIDPAALRDLIRAPWPTTKLVCIENTHNRCGGSVITASATHAIAEVAHAAGAQVHIDGARIFNAAVALETDARTLLADGDSVQFCFSKGLGAPIGSMLTGSTEFIDRARMMRRMVGGSMRQAGIVASAALWALQHNLERLADDHANARRLAEGLGALPHIVMDPAGVGSNMVFFTVEGVDGADFRARLAAEGVLCTGTSPQRVRMVCHLDVSRADIDAAVERVRAVLAAMPASTPAKS